jgi:hypothetical protein
MSMTHTDRIKSDLNTIWRSRMRNGDTVAEADEFIATIVRELDEGDSGLLEIFLEHAKRELH